MGFLGNLFNTVSNAFGGLGQGLMGLFGGHGGGGQPMQASAGGMGGGGAKIGGGMMGGGMNPGMLGLGAGMMALPQMFGRKVQPPNFNTSDINNMRNFTQNPPALPPGMADQINQSLGIKEEQETRNLKNLYRNAQPGFDERTNSEYLRDLGYLQRNQQAERANALMAPTLQYQQPLREGLGNLAGLSEEQQIMGAQSKAAQRQRMQDLFSGLGGMVANKGLYPQGNFGGTNWLSNIFKGNY